MSGSAEPERGLLGYLLLPRPADLSKAVVLVVGAALGFVGVRRLPTTSDVIHLLMAVLLLELCVYQARYQWNDIRGFDADQQHPDRVQRGRLPGPASRREGHIAVSAAVAAFRLLVAVTLVLTGLAPVLLLSASVGVLLAAAVYEGVRSLATRTESGTRSGAVPVLWVLAGAGYAVRGLTGFLVGSNSALPGVAYVYAATAFWCAGIVFVTTRWAVESLAFAHWTDGTVEWQADRRHRRGHLLGLTAWLRFAADGDPDLRRRRVLRDGAAWHAPWNVAFALTALTAVAAGWRCAPPTPVDAFLIVVTAVAAVTMLVTRRGRRRASAVLLAVAAVAAIADGRPAAVFVLAACMLYVACTHQCLDGVGGLTTRFPRKVVRPVRGPRVRNTPV